ncbi:DUF4293 domain-containing protein [Myroides sp. LJL119]
MLQRIQSVYLFLAFVVMGILPFVFPLWKNAENKDIYFMMLNFVPVLFGLSAALSAVAFLNFKNRQKQFVINRLNMISNVILLGLLIYRTLTVSGDAFTQVSEKGIGMFLPIVSILFLVLANRAIKKDEDLVKSVDRLR